MKDEFDVFGEIFGWDSVETAYLRTKHDAGIKKMQDDILEVFKKLIPHV